VHRRILLVGLGALLTGAAAEPPVIGRPTPVSPPAGPTVPSLSPAQIDPTLAIGGKELKARKIDTRLSVAVFINGHGPYPFIVDSGADTSVVGVRLAQSLQLPLGSPAILNGMTSRDLVSRVKIAQLTLGDTTIADLDLPALREADIGGDGMIGIDALHERRLMLDFDNRTIKVEDARRPEAKYPNEIVVIGRRSHGQLILTHVSAGGIPLDAIIDTGSEITIGNSALRDKLIRGNRDKFVTVPVTGVTGVKANMDLARIGELRIGPVTLTDVPIAFADVPPFALFGLNQEPSLLLGTDILESFRRVSLDFRARKVRFQLKRCRDHDIVISTDPEAGSRISSRAPDVCAR
jgi:hypothetical protein